MKILDLKKGDFVKKKGSNIELEVIEVGNEPQSGYNFVKLYNDVTLQTTKLIDVSNYLKI